MKTTDTPAQKLTDEELILIQELLANTPADWLANKRIADQYKRQTQKLFHHIEALKGEMGEMRNAAGHFFHCCQCSEGDPCREGERFFEVMYGFKYGEDALTTTAKGGAE